MLSPRLAPPAIALALLTMLSGCGLVAAEGLKGSDERSICELSDDEAEALETSVREGTADLEAAVCLDGPTVAQLLAIQAAAAGMCPRDETPWFGQEVDWQHGEVVLVTTGEHEIDAAAVRLDVDVSLIRFFDPMADVTRGPGPKLGSC